VGLLLIRVGTRLGGIEAPSRPLGPLA